MARVRFAGILVSRINEKRQVLGESLTDGACKDYPHYRDMCGYLRALNEVIAMCEEIEKGDE